ncbi:MAG: DUF2085 domain-containing protein [bacterium]
MEPDARQLGSAAGPRGGARWFWPLLLVLPAAFLLLAAAAGPESPIGTIVEAGFAPFCHQIPGRSLLGGRPLAVCTRCAGFYTGLALAGMTGAAAAAAGWRGRVPGAVLAAGLAPLAVDGTANLLGLWASPAAVRALIGMVAALPLALILVGRHEAE